MSRLASGYVKVRREQGAWLVSVHKAVVNGHVQLAQGECVAGDVPALRVELIRCITTARAGQRSWEKQADGND